MERRGAYNKAIDEERDPMARLASEILIQAVKDWRGLIKRKAWRSAVLQTKDKSFEDLRVFFHSDWCALLMESFGVQPDHILRLLEIELKEAREKDKGRRKKK
jgi:hypothetical protein